MATSTPDRLAPSTACIVQEKLKAFNAVAFDIAAVCSGFLFGMSVASQYVASGVYDNVLVIGADTFSKIHFELVGKIVSRYSFVKTFSGTKDPVPIIFTFLTICFITFYYYSLIIKNLIMIVISPKFIS